MDGTTVATSATDGRYNGRRGVEVRCSCKSAIIALVDCGENCTLSGVDVRDRSSKGGALRNPRMDPLLGARSFGFVSI